MARHDSTTALEQLGDRVMTGPTGTNISDLLVVAIDGAVTRPTGGWPRHDCPPRRGDHRRRPQRPGGGLLPRPRRTAAAGARATRVRRRCLRHRGVRAWLPCLDRRLRARDAATRGLARPRPGAPGSHGQPGRAVAEPLPDGTSLLLGDDPAEAMEAVELPLARAMPVRSGSSRPSSVSSPRCCSRRWTCRRRILRCGTFATGRRRPVSPAPA